MKRLNVIVTAISMLALVSLVLPFTVEGEEIAGFVNTIEYGNFDVSLAISDLSRVPEEIIDSLRQLGLDKRVAFVIVTPTAWATDSSEDHDWVIFDIDGTKYASLDPFLEDELAEKVESLDERTKRFIFRSSPRHTFVPDEANPLLVFFTADLPPVDSWERVIFRDFLNGFQVDMHKIKKGDLKGQEEGELEFL